ncbi:MAG TPA: response regulator, partial [Polyangia bacterium]
MSQRYVYLVDADANLNAHLVGELGRYGFRVDAAVDSNELMQLKDDLPSLIVLCIDPKRTGWAVCNRLRKSATLKTTPLIITSAEATEKDFEDHKKLKTRAEEYLHKPFAVDALIEKIGGLIGMPEVDPSTHSLEIPMESEEVAIEDDAAIIEEAPDDEPIYEGSQVSTQHGMQFGEGEEDDNTRIGVMNVDGEVDVETEAAFAAIGAEGLEDSTSVTETEELKPTLGRMVMAKRAVPMPSVTEVPLDEGFGGDDDPFSLPQQAGGVPAPLPPAESQPIDTFRAQQAKDQSGPIDLGLDAVAEQASHEPARPRAASQPKIITSAHPPAPSSAALGAAALAGAVAMQQSAADTQAHDTGTAAVTELKRERDTLKREVEDLKQKLASKPVDGAAAPAPAAAGFSREREFLNLRETINKKEREVLDLKDAVDVKERAVLDASTKLRDTERKLGDLEGRSLGTEKELVSAREKIDALGHDKERAVEREKQVKARLDDALKTITRYEDELENWKQKHATDVGAAEKAYSDAVSMHGSEVQQLKSQHQSAVDAMQAEHGERMQKTLDAHDEDKALITAKFEEERGTMEAEHARAVEKLRESAVNERDGIRLRFEQQTADLAQQHDATVQQLRHEHDGVVAAIKREHGEAVTEKDQLHADEIAGLRARYTRDAKETERRHQDEIAAIHGAH